MIYLILSILLNAYLGIAFVIFNKKNIDLYQAIVFNYWVCVITGSLVLGNFPINVEAIQAPWFKWSIAMGFLFITVFNLIAISSIKAGVTITQTANKLSLVIPVILSYLLYKDQMPAVKVIGIIVALIAVYFVVKKDRESDSTSKSKEFMLPVILFLGSGIIDSLTTYVQKTFLTSNEISNTYLISGFFTAGCFGAISLAILFIQKKKKFEIKNLVAGIVLGVPNYFSIYYLVKALQSPLLSSSATIPINNVGVLLVVSLVGIFFFKEKLNRLNYVGIALTLLAILLIYLGDTFFK